MAKRRYQQNPWDPEFEPEGQEERQLTEQELKELEKKSEKVKKAILYLIVVVIAGFGIGFYLFIEVLGPISCSSGSTLIGNPGSADSFCIDNQPFNNDQAVLYKQAVTICSRNGKQLCTDLQFTKGCQVLEEKNLTVVDQEGEWVYTEGFGNIVQGVDSCASKTVASDVAQKPFRCCTT